MAIKKLEHVGVMVNDLETSISFYRDILGLDLIEHLQLEDSAIQLVFLGNKETGQIFVELVSGRNKNYPDEGKVNHIAFTVENIEEEIERLKSLKVIFTNTEILSFKNGTKYIFFKGPDGEKLELFQPSGL
ncbi:MAG: VOC family protein [Bacillota bacterium]|nr:VOC family protein [Bacillota bacterium]